MRKLYGIPDEYAGYDQARFAVVPVPFDGTSTWIKGADQGPRALHEASEQVELYDIETDSEVYKQGIYLHPPIISQTVEGMTDSVEECVGTLLDDGKLPIILGGEHSVSIGSVRACAARYAGLSVLHLDAHSDRRTAYEGSPLNHACVAARFKDSLDTVVAAGIRSMDSSEKGMFGEGELFTAQAIHADPEWISRVLDKLSGDVYISLDLDVFDPAFMPSTGTPEPGGLDWYQVTGLCKAVCEQRTVIGLDIVELCPSKNKAPDFMAAKLLYKLMSYIDHCGKE